MNAAAVLAKIFSIWGHVRWLKTLQLQSLRTFLNTKTHTSRGWKRYATAGCWKRCSCGPCENFSIWGNTCPGVENAAAALAKISQYPVVENPSLHFCHGPTNSRAGFRRFFVEKKTVGLTPFLPFSGTDQLEGGISSIFRSKLTLFLHFCHEPTRGRTCPVVENAAAAVLAKIAQFENNFWTKISVNALKN